MGRFMAPWPPLLSHGHVRVFLAAAAWVPRNCVWRAINAMPFYRRIVLSHVYHA